MIHITAVMHTFTNYNIILHIGTGNFKATYYKMVA